MGDVKKLIVDTVIHNSKFDREPPAKINYIKKIHSREEFIAEAKKNGSVFTQYDLRALDLSGLFLTGYYFNKCDLTMTDFTFSKVNKAFFSNTIISLVNYTATDLTETSFTNCTANKTIFRDTILIDVLIQGGEFIECFFKDIDGSGMNIFDSVFKDLEFNGGLMHSTCIFKTDLTTVKFIDINVAFLNLYNCIYNDDTILPKNIKPKEENMIKEYSDEHEKFILDKTKHENDVKGLTSYFLDKIAHDTFKVKNLSVKELKKIMADKKADNIIMIKYILTFISLTLIVFLIFFSKINNG